MAATLFVQPMDLIKNRMQLSGEGGKAKEHRNTLHAIRSIMMKEGISGMYSGLSAGLLRQATYTTTRLGIYTWLFDTMSGLVYFQNSTNVNLTFLIPIFFLALMENHQVLQQKLYLEWLQELLEHLWELQPR